MHNSFKLKDIQLLKIEGVLEEYEI